MICCKCKKEIADGSLFCSWCGKKQAAEKRRAVKSRGNGQGCAYLVSKGNWCAEATIAYTEDGRRVRKKKQGFKTKREALEYVPILKKEKEAASCPSLRKLYDLWFSSLSVAKITRDCYRAAFPVFSSVEHFPLDRLSVDDLQGCVDACSRGDSVKRNARVVLGLIYRFAISRGFYSGIIAASFIHVPAANPPQKASFTPAQIDAILSDGSAVAKIAYCACFLGYRPRELLSVTVGNYNRRERFISGVGVKTKAGKNRVVTVPLRIVPLLDEFCSGKGEADLLFSLPPHSSYVKYLNAFNALMARLGFSGFTPHSCRHTYATLLMRAAGADKLKLELIGHASEEMLRYYQDGQQLDDLRAVTDLL